MADHLKENFQALGEWLARPRGPFAKFFAIATVIIALPLAALMLSPYILSTLAPPIDPRLDLYSINRPIAFTFLDSDGNQIGHRGAIVGERLKLADMPPYLPAAFIAVEDRNFYSHGGIDIHGLLRAMWVNFRAHHVVQGGSTITQQTAKVVFLNPKRTYQRKVQELFDAESLEKSLSKKQILALYLNRIYLGSGAYGVDGAAHVYFSKSARELTLPEAAMLATLTTAPSVFSPRRDLAAAQERASHVLDDMVKTHAITREQAEEAKAHPAVVTDRSLQEARNFFLDTAADEATRLASVNGQPPSADLVVRTTLDTKLQEAARGDLNRILTKQGRRAHAHEGAVIVMKPDGAITAMVGGRDYDESEFNRATQAKRQPGSAFKPFVYLAAVESGISPWETRSDSPVDIDGWAPTNYGNRSYGTITLADALAHSVNTITASLAQEVGVDKVVEAAQRLGIKSPLEANASLALGTSEVTPLELTSAYAAFANGGLRVQPYMVTQVSDNAGHALYTRATPQFERVIANHVDRDMVAMLYGVVTQGTGRSASIAGHQAAGKTGTTQDYRDAWFVGFTADYVACVWVGNDHSTPMRNVTGGSIPAEVWRAVMTTAEDGLPAKPLDMSEPQAPIEDNGIITADTGEAAVENDTNGTASTDEEAGGANVDEDSESSSSDSDNSSNGDADSGSGTKTAKHDNGGWWNWLFSGNGGNEPRRGRPPSSNEPNAAVPTPHEAPPAHSVPLTRAAPPPDDTDSADEDQTYPERIGPPPVRVVRPRREEPPPPRSGPPPPPPPDADQQGPPPPGDEDSDSPQ
ncbi:MAG TPA: PBP1A family penicillin-binding protein [Rhizomicrobium sp.]|jgi:penicillin-binding protein 1A|nr:PBP1A family penicillin-binding protein [Rhizomicrobium sp.]